jgi:putative hydrolase of the HAD superfamily
MTAARERPTALLTDLDGVLRVFDPAVGAAIEARYGLPAGAIGDTAMQWSRLRPAITGEVSRAEWLAGVADALADRVGGHPAAQQMIATWDAYPGEVVPEMLAFVREVRGAGVPVVLATNGTDALERELAAVGLSGEFDAVVNSSQVGAHKPTREFFEAACAAVDTPAQRCLFIDDEDRNVRGARVAGLSAYRYSGPHDFGYLRALFAS